MSEGGSQQVLFRGSSKSRESSRRTLKSHWDKGVQSKHITLTQGKLWEVHLMRHWIHFSVFRYPMCKAEN
jgi:hypothetical protein